MLKFWHLASFSFELLLMIAFCPIFLCFSKYDFLGFMQLLFNREEKLLWHILRFCVTVGSGRETWRSKKFLVEPELLCPLHLVVWSREAREPQLDDWSIGEQCDLTYTKVAALFVMWAQVPHHFVSKERDGREKSGAHSFLCAWGRDDAVKYLPSERHNLMVWNMFKERSFLFFFLIKFLNKRLKIKSVGRIGLFLFAHYSCKGRWNQLFCLVKILPFVYPVDWKDMLQEMSLKPTDRDPMLNWW